MIIISPQTISASGQLISSMITSVPIPNKSVNVNCTPAKLMDIRTTSTSCVARTMIWPVSAPSWKRKDSVCRRW